MAQQPPVRDLHVDQWIDITDFTPGLYNNTYISGASGSIVPAPIGAANASRTQGCMALPNGGVGPLPKFTLEQTLPSTATFPTRYIVGLISTPLSTQTQLLVMLEGQNSTHHLFQVKAVAAGSSTYTTVHSASVAQLTGKGFFCCPFPVMTRMTIHTTATTKPGYPTIVFPYADATDSHHTSGHLYIYPPVLTHTSFSLQDLIVAAGTGFSSVTGQVIAHQGRVIVLAGISYTWPGPHKFPTNEQICFTTPSNSSSYGFQQEILVPEFPYGYGGAGSISASELFLIKKRGGGVIVTGDINNPYVTFLPGVQTTGDIYGRAGSSTKGLFYCSDKQGAWLWNGGNTAQKISPQLDDDFYIPTNIIPTSNSERYFCQEWGEWVLFSGGWIYNTRINSWWRYSGVAHTFFHYTPGQSTDVMYAARQVVPSTTRKFVWKITKSTPVNTWQWCSLPIKLSESKYINIRELVLYASNSTTSARSRFFITMIWTGPDGASHSATFSTTATVLHPETYPTMMRVPIGISTAQNIILTITAQSTSHAAPILHQISFGIQTRQHLKTLV